MIKPEQITDSEAESENEVFPVEPRYHPVHKITRKIYDFFASAKLAMFLLVVILGCCLAGVTIVRGLRAWQLIFNTLWFNALLVLLVINIACCFFGRIWGRRVTVISFGMILFHLSFVAILLGVVYNSLFYFRGNIRLTEGEVLPSYDPQSYDRIDKGRFFKYSLLKGETSLNKMHTGYKIGGDDKRVAYEVEVGEKNAKKTGMIYITHKLSHNGFDYFNDKEGYSLLIMLDDKQGRNLYGAHLPLQSIRQKDKSYIYITGYKGIDAVKPSVVPFPAPPEKPRFAMQASYQPSRLNERGGEALYKLYALDERGKPKFDRVIAEGKAAIGESFAAGEYLLTAREVRYWVGMMVRYEPGKPIVLTSLWVALAGMCITTVGRMVRSRV